MNNRILTILMLGAGALVCALPETNLPGLLPEAHALDTSAGSTAEDASGQLTEVPPPGTSEAGYPTFLEALQHMSGKAGSEIRDVTFECDLWTVVFTTRGGAMRSILLHQYAEKEGSVKYWRHKAKLSKEREERERLERKVRRMEWRERRVAELEESILQADQTGDIGLSAALNRELRWISSFEVIGEEGYIAPELHIANLNTDKRLVYQCEDEGGQVNGTRSITFVGRVSGLTIEKTYTLNAENHEIDLAIRLDRDEAFDRQDAGDTDYSLWWDPLVGYDWRSGRGAGEMWINVDGKRRERHKFVGDMQKQKIRKDAQVRWMAVQNRYFVAAVIPQARALPLQMPMDRSAVAFYFRTEPMKPGKEETYKFRIYAGPKTLEGLQSQSVQLEDLSFGGWTGGLSKIVLLVLRWVNWVTHNYGLSIIAVTILMRFSTHPLNKKQQRSTERMRTLQPEIKKLQEKFKNEPQRLQQETWKLYKTHKVNPIGGCLPLILTMPIFIALWTTFGNAIELRGAGFLWMSDLAEPDTIFYIPLPFAIIPVNVLPLLYGAVSIVQQTRMTPMDPKQASMMKWLPIMFIFIFYGFPSGVMLYLFLSNLLMIGSQFWYEKSKKRRAVIEVNNGRTHSQSKDRRSRDRKSTR